MIKSKTPGPTRGQMQSIEQIVEGFEQRNLSLINKQKEYLNLINKAISDQAELKRDLLENIGLHKVDESTIEGIEKGKVLKVSRLESFVISGIYLIKQKSYLGLKQINYYDQSKGTYECETKHGKESILKSEVIALFKILH